MFVGVNARERNHKPSTWERLSTKQKLVYLATTVTFLAAPVLWFLTKSDANIQAGIGPIDGKAISAGEKAVSSATRAPAVEKVAITVELQKEREKKEEMARARQLADQAWFVDPKVGTPSIEETVLPIDYLQEMTAKQKRYEDISALHELGVSWETIEKLVNYTQVARIDKVTAEEGKKTVKKDLSLVLRGRTSIAEITAADFGFVTLPHEDAHTLVWTGIRGIDEAAATWFQYFVNKETPPKPLKFMGCGLAPEDFDYDTAYYDFDGLSIWFGLRTGDNLFATIVEIYSQWAGHPLEREEQPMPIEHLYRQIEEKYKIPQAEIKARFEAPESFRCR